MRAMVVTLVAVLSLSFAGGALAQGPRILFLSKSQGFEHGPVAEKDGKPCLAASVLNQLANDNGATLTATKDASLINAENLKNFDLVIFYTQGDLTQPSKDGGGVMGPNGVKDLLDWIKNGGAFMGFHSASDTFHTPPGGEVTPYLKMVGAEFTSHGQQFEGTLKVVDPQHPAIAAYPKEWKVKEEWYLFNNFNRDTMHILAVLDPGPEGAKQEKYRIPPYPMIWCSAYGKGKVFFNGMGHREELWNDDAFKEDIVNAAEWVMDANTDPSETAPNWDKVMPQFEPKK